MHFFSTGEIHRRFFWPCTILLLAVLATVQIVTIRNETQTWDEGIELGSGYAYLKTGDYRMEPQHPPLQRVLSALPLLLLNPLLPLNDISWRDANALDFGYALLYTNRVPADTILFFARVPTIVQTLVLALAIVLWTRRRFGDLAGVLALLFFSFDPTVIAIGRYIKNDMTLALFVFLACIAWNWHLRSRRRLALVAAGLMFGCALLTKFSAVFLGPVFVTMYAIDWLRRKPHPPISDFIDAHVIIVAVAALLAGLVYAPYTKQLLPATPEDRSTDPSIIMLNDAVDTHNRVGAALAWAGRELSLQAHPLLTGIALLTQHNDLGHDAYLLGMTSKSGWWYYFPVAFAVKEPVATLCAIAIALFLALRRGLPVPPVLWVPVVIYGILAMASHINIGIRHILPVYPFLFIIAAAGLAQLRWRYKLQLIAAIAAGLVLESAAIYPHYLTFFNTLAGGPDHGPQYLLDSNIDWGQDGKYVKTYMQQHGIPRLCLEFFGSFDPAYYGIWYDHLPRTSETEQRANIDCIAAISVNPLMDLYLEPGAFAWLRERKPFAKIAHSIYLYDLRRNRGDQRLTQSRWIPR